MFPTNLLIRGSELPYSVCMKAINFVVNMLPFSICVLFFLGFLWEGL